MPARKDKGHPQFRGADVVEALEAARRAAGFPKIIRVDNGPEFVSRDLDLWAYQRDVTLDFSRPGKPADNAFVDSFNGKFRAECLNAYWLLRSRWRSSRPRRRMQQRLLRRGR